jgi:hypothetical protein
MIFWCGQEVGEGGRAGVLGCGRIGRGAMAMDTGAGQALDAQVTLVLAGDGVAPLEALVGQLMSPGNEQRGQAEQLFNYCKQHHADALVMKMIHALQVSRFFQSSSRKLI